MVQLSDIMYGALLDQMLAGGYIRAKKHPTEPYTIYNYAEKTAYEKMWNPATLQCRGLIVDDNGTIVARPFPKFFNLGEPSAVEAPTKPFRAFEKHDGSLAVAFRRLDGTVDIATRGSFESEQAIHATALLHRKYPNFDPQPGCTYLFEIIYPTNRIVVSYGGQDDLILLEVLDNDTGLQAIDLAWNAYTGPWVEEAEFTTLAELAEQPDRPNQ